MRLLCRNLVRIYFKTACRKELYEGLSKEFREMTDDMTVFIVSQRTASIQYADKIVVLDDGDIAGIGTHEELLKDCEVYREIYDSQYKKEGN